MSHSSQIKTGTKAMERSESVDNTCPVCHDNIDVVAIGPCDHRVCYRCSTRMRVLCETMDCPICRSLMPQVAFVWGKMQFKDVSLRDCIPNRKYKIFFEDEAVEDKYLDLLEFNCRLCRNRDPDRTFAQLQTHMRKEHQLFACDLCVSHLKIFPFERKFYTRKNLALHRRVGDPDDKSYKGHPLCEFCDSRYNDKDELLKHLRKDHYFCHFCDQDGSNAYYDQYADLMNHFSESHYLCTEGECSSPSTRFTHAFSSEIDLKAHKASAHNKNMSKAQSREARTIEVDFQLPPRRQGNGRGMNSSDGTEDMRGGSGTRGRGHDRYNRRRERHDPELQRAIDASLEESEPRPPVEERVPDPINDFPTLNGAATAAVNTFTPAYISQAPQTPLEDFPSLSSSSSKALKSAPRPTKAYSRAMTTTYNTQPPAPAVPKESKPVSLGSVTAVSRERWSSTAPQKTLEDYPSLAVKSGVSASALLATSTNGWVKTPQSNISTVSSKPSQPPRAIPSRNAVRNISDEKEFPSLGGTNKPRENVFKNPFGPDWSNPQSNKKKAPVVSRKEKLDDSFELPDSYKSFEPSAIEDVVQETTGINNNKVKSTEKPPSSGSDFPSLPPRAQKEQKGVGGGEKKKKKNKKTEESSQQKPKKVVDSNASLNDIALTLVKDGKPVRNGHAEKKRNANKSATPKQMDWFDNPVVETTENERNSHSQVSSVNNFPSLHAMSASVQHPKPPPGFKPDPPPPTSPITPPGFQATTNGNIPHAPPGFSDKSTPSPAAAYDKSVYIQPSDFKSRNLQLIQDIREALETVEDGFANFRALSGQFRQGLMEVSDYFYSCQDLMGEADFTRIFPELVGLLPDIPKQRELFQLFQLVSGKSSKGKSSSHWQTSKVMLPCPACGQVVLKGDQQHHELSHGKEGEFPTLGNLNLGASTSNGAAPAAVGTKGAWIRA